MPAILDKCVAKLQKQGKSKSSAFAICTASLKKKGKLDDDFIASLAKIGEHTFCFRELMAYAEHDALQSWYHPTLREPLPETCFIDPTNRTYPYRDSEGTISPNALLAAESLAKTEEAGAEILLSIETHKGRLMKKKEKGKDAEVHKFIIPISIPENAELSDKKKTNVQILKTGKFRHPWWGILNFDSAFFDRMIRNFEANIPQEKIAFDFQHNPESGAGAWVQNLSQKGDGLFGDVTLTVEGKKAIKENRFAYFSAEYTDNYIEHQFQESDDDEGKPVTIETKINHGPTLMGGGFTNRPFIKGMAPVTLSEDGKHIIMEEVMEGDEGDDDGNTNSSLKEVYEDMKKKLKELLESQADSESRIAKLEEVKEPDDAMTQELVDLRTKLEATTVSIASLSDEEKGKAFDEVMDQLSETRNLATQQGMKIETQTGQITELSGNVKDLTKSVDKLLKTNTKLEDTNFKSTVEKTLKALGEKGAFPGTVEVARKYLLHEDAKGFVITLSEGEGDEKKDAQKTLADFMDEIIESIPRENRFVDTEKSDSVINPTGNTGKTMTEADVVKYAKEHELSYEDALIELSKDGKLVED